MPLRSFGAMATHQAFLHGIFDVLGGDAILKAFASIRYNVMHGVAGRSIILLALFLALTRATDQTFLDGIVDINVADAFFEAFAGSWVDVIKAVPRRPILLLTLFQAWTGTTDPAFLDDIVKVLVRDASFKAFTCLWIDIVHMVARISIRKLACLFTAGAAFPAFFDKIINILVIHTLFNAFTGGWVDVVHEVTEKSLIDLACLLAKTGTTVEISFIVAVREALVLTETSAWIDDMLDVAGCSVSQFARVVVTAGATLIASLQVHWNLAHGNAHLVAFASVWINNVHK